MKYFQLEGTIDEALLTRFMDFCNNNASEEWTIVINSGGGKSTLATMILSMINSNSDKITLISAGCYSAAFYIFYFAKCEKKIINGSLGMHHRAFIKDVYVNINGNPIYNEDIYNLQNLSSSKDNFISKQMNKKEKSAYNKDENVFFTFKRMKELFPEVEVIK